jgi:hypothetical protein
MIDEHEPRRRRATMMEKVEACEGTKLVGHLPRRITEWQAEAALLHGRSLHCITRGDQLSELWQEAERLVQAVQAELFTLEERVANAPPSVAHSAPVTNVKRASERLLQLLSEVSGGPPTCADQPRATISEPLNAQALHGVAAEATALRPEPEQMTDRARSSGAD